MKSDQLRTLPVFVSLGIARSGINVEEYIDRFVAGDYGITLEEEKANNQEELTHQEGIIFGEYVLPGGEQQKELVIECIFDEKDSTDYHQNNITIMYNFEDPNY